MQNDTDIPEEIEKSKSQLKREMTDLQDMGKELVDLPREQLEKISLPESLYDAILAARLIRQHGARKRQLQFIGKLMRHVDAEPIRTQIDTLIGQSTQAVEALHHIERWRDKLLTDGDEALSALLETYPQADRQHLRQLLRNAAKESTGNKPPKSVRVLFKYLRQLIETENE